MYVKQKQDIVTLLTKNNNSKSKSGPLLCFLLLYGIFCLPKFM